MPNVNQRPELPGKLSERLYRFVQRHYWTNRLLDPIRWWLERRGK